MPRTFLFLNLGHAQVHFALMVYPTIALTLESELGLPYADLIALAAWSYGAIAIATLPVGWLGDRLSRRGLMIFFFVGLGLATLATGLTDPTSSIAVGLFAIGLFAAIYHPVGIAMVAAAAPGRLGRAMGINGVWGNLGLAAAPAATAALASAFGWRLGLVLPGIVVLATGFAFALLTRPGATRNRAAAPPASPEPVGRAAAVRIGVLLVVTTVVGGIVFTVTTVSLPKLVAERIAAGDATDAGSVTTLVLAVAGFAQIVVGTMLDRLPLKRIYVGLLVAEAVAFAAVAALGGLPSIAAAAVAMLLVFGLIPVGDTLVARVVPNAWRARVYAISYQLSLGISVAAVPLMARIYERWGFETLYWLLAAAIGIEVAAALALPAVVNRRTMAAQASA
ncbi:MAG: MFS transporter [Alphaproteobacteria bacterium]